MNPSKEHSIRSVEALIYSDKPVNGIQVNLEAAGK
jgi:hypothetical protein